jgi:hypothetical protein
VELTQHQMRMRLQTLASSIKEVLKQCTEPTLMVIEELGHLHFGLSFVVVQVVELILICSIMVFMGKAQECLHQEELTSFI